MNKRKLTILSSTSAFAITALALWLSIPLGEMQTYGEYIEYSPERMSQLADLIVVAQYTNTVTEETFDRDYPLRAISEFKINEVLKGEYDSKSIDIFHNGDGAFYSQGMRIDVTLMNGNIEFLPNEEVLLFLDYDEGNILGTGYYIISANLGKYSISDGLVKHVNPEKDTSLENLKIKIQQNKN